MNTLQTILTILGSISAVSAAIIYIGKRIIDKTLDIGLEKYKASLNKELETHKSELTKGMEEFKANLQILNLERQIKYSRLHEERGKSIKETYELLIDLQEKLEYFTTIFQGPQWTTDHEREKGAIESRANLYRYFQRNRIYYPEAICSLIDEILSVSHNIIVDMSVAKVTAVDAYSGPERALAKKEWREANSKVSSEIGAARQKLQKEFKKILGVE
jgi:hypothetical protein